MAEEVILTAVEGRRLDRWAVKATRLLLARVKGVPEENLNGITVLSVQERRTLDREFANWHKLALDSESRDLNTLSELQLYVAEALYDSSNEHVREKVLKEAEARNHWKGVVIWILLALLAGFFVYQALGG